MDYYKQISVNTGCRLVIEDNAVVTSHNIRWSGIVVFGNSNESQLPRDQNGLPLYQGELIINSGGTVSNALYGIITKKIEDGVGYMASGGGIVRLQNAKFKNNIIVFLFVIIIISILLIICQCQMFHI
ncbi:MAG: hypothetical protein K9J21_00785 [Bacteroidales bacterium]|nr:hypothetical protein [Bacteroidales bacterium]